MTNRKIKLMLGIFIFFCAVSAYFLYTNGTFSKSPRQPNAPSENKLPAPPQAYQESPPAGEMQTTDASNPPPLLNASREFSREDVSNALQNSYGKTIYHPRIQLEAIEKLIQFLKNKYKENWRDHVLEYLTDAFPDYADVLYQRFQNFEAYKQWLSENYDTLLGMTQLERKDLIWEKRNQFFGEDAATIWEAEIKNDALLDTLERIDGQRNLTFGSKLDTYVTEIDRIYGDKADTFKTRHQQKLMDNFLNLNAVQKDLQNMSTSERRENLRNIRIAMGLDESALERWDALDRARDERWERGQQYMKERERLMHEYRGAELDRRLDDARNNFFGTEADIIKNEELGGFYRFKDRPRRYGMN